MNKKPAFSASAGFSIAGALMTMVFFYIVYHITGSRHPWFIYPSFAVLWWPLSVILLHGQIKKVYSLAASFIIIAFLIIVNRVTSPDYLWFIYPTFAVLWWPLSVLLITPRTKKLFSFAGAALIIAFLVITNYMYSPSCLWFLYSAYPVLWWPMGVLLGKKMGSWPVAIIGCAISIAYYIGLNVLLSPGFPWAIFTAYALLWWPLSIVFAKNKNHIAFAVCGTLLSAIFFVATNFITTPSTIWAVYPIFAFLWWPLSVYYFSYRKANKFISA